MDLYEVNNLGTNYFFIHIGWSNGVQIFTSVQKYQGGTETIKYPMLRFYILLGIDFNKIGLILNFIKSTLSR